ncbi:MAG TPA: hypothetical protein VLN49_22930 [Gemmatimonadaceae bacterium]|nr:hypothetical protein [Gemmatimonadaceae bacterium]
MRLLRRAVVLGTLAAALPGGAAGAQLIGVMTDGALSGPGCTFGVCTFGGYRLWFEGNTFGFPPQRNPGESVPLGSFLLQCDFPAPNFTPACPSGVPVPIPAGVTFTLFISSLSQTVLLNGAARASGDFTGFVEWAPNVSTLTWSPSGVTTQFGPEIWEIPAVQLSPPLAGTPFNVRETQFFGQFVIAPEPGTLALLAAGLLVLLPLLRHARGGSGR